MKYLDWIVLLVSLALVFFGWSRFCYAAETQSSRTLEVLQAMGPDFETLPETARAIDLATPHRWERALLISVAWHESRFKPEVMRCEVKGDKGKASGLWQSWAIACPVGVQAQAREALRHLRSALAYCKGANLELRVYGAVSLYATGRTCLWKGAGARVATFKKVNARL